jgi:uncharacterized delta-60 repeat protein
MVMSINQAPSLTTADGNGIVRLDLGPFNAGQPTVVLQADGKIIVNGHAWTVNPFTNDTVLVRYNADGTLDTAFGTDGGVILSTADPVLSSLTQAEVAVQADGKIVVSDDGFAVTRYNSDGSLDTSFGTGGMVPGSRGPSFAYGIVLEPDGTIIATGDNGSFGLARFDSNGNRDLSFGVNGEATASFGSSISIRAQGLVGQPDGKVVVAGSIDLAGHDDFALARYNTDGSLDATFGTGGKVTTDFASGEDEAFSVTLQADGKIVAAGRGGVTPTSTTNFVLARYNADGSLDTSFGAGGKVTTDGGLSEHANSVKIQSDGKIVVAGYALISPVNRLEFVLLRYNSDGSLDSSFGTGGKVVSDFGLPGNPTSEAYSLVIQPDGKILVVGTGGPNGNGPGDFLLARYSSDGSLDTSFGNGAALNGPAFFVEDKTPTVLNPGATVHDADLDAAGNYAGASLTLARHGGADAQDVFGASGNLTALGEGGNIVLSGVTIGTVTHNSAGMLSLTFDANATGARVNEAMRDITYFNTSDTPAASVQVDWSFSDGNTGAQGSGGALTAAGSTTVHIAPADDAPVNTVPAAFDTFDNTDHAITGLSVSDPDTSSLRMTLTVDHGTLTVGAIGGVTVEFNGSDFVRLTGSPAQIDAALAAANNVLYHSTAGFHGTDVLTVATVNATDTTSHDTDTVAINVQAQYAFGQETFELSAFAIGAGGWTDQTQYPREVADVNGDHMADIVGFGADGVIVSLATGNGHFGALTSGIDNFGFLAAGGGWTSENQYPRQLADVDGDGMADIVGFGADGVIVSLATGNGHFAPPVAGIQNFGFLANGGGWTSQDQYPRQVADVNGDGMADIVGFGADGVIVSLATGSGHFASPVAGIQNFGFLANGGGWTSQDQYPRLLADVNGDGMADIVGFGADGVIVSLATGDGHFASPVAGIQNFGFLANGGGWTSDHQYPRLLADVNGDHMADIVGFGADGAIVSLATGDGHFASPVAGVQDFGFLAAGGAWASQDQSPRQLADVNGDGAADIIGFGHDGVFAALSNGGFHLI